MLYKTLTKPFCCSQWPCEPGKGTETRGLMSHGLQVDGNGIFWGRHMPVPAWITRATVSMLSWACDGLCFFSNFSRTKAK